MESDNINKLELNSNKNNFSLFHECNSSINQYSSYNHLLMIARFSDDINFQGIKNKAIFLKKLEKLTISICNEKKPENPFDNIEDKIFLESEETKIFRHICKILEFKLLTDFEKQYLLYFSLFPSIKISLSFLYKFFSIPAETRNEFENSLNSLVKNGWLRIDDYMYEINPLIQRAIHNKLHPNTKNCSIFINNIANQILKLTYFDLESHHILIAISENIINNFEIENHIITDLSKKLSAIFLQSGNYQKSLEYQLKIFHIMEKIFYTNPLDLAEYYENISSLYKHLNNYQKSLEFELQAMQIKEKILNNWHPEFVNIYNKIVISYRCLGDYQNSLKIDLKVLEIKKLRFNEFHPDIVDSYNSLATTYRLLGDYNNSLFYDKKVLEIREKVLHKTHPNLIISFDNIVNSLIGIGDYLTALEFCNIKITLEQKIYGKTSKILVQSFNYIALIYKNLKEYKKSLAFYLKAMKIYEALLDDEDIEIYVAKLNNDMGSLYLLLDKPKQAKDRYFLETIILKKVLANQESDLESAYYKIAKIYKKIPGNLGTFNHNIEEFDTNIHSENKQNTHLASIFHEIGISYLRIEDYFNSLDYFFNSINYCRDNSIENKILKGANFTNIAFVYSQRKEYKNSNKFAIKGIEIKEKYLDKNHPDLALSYHNFAESLFHTGTNDRATFYIDKAIEIRSEILSNEDSDFQKSIKLKLMITNVLLGNKINTNTKTDYIRIGGSKFFY